MKQRNVLITVSSIEQAQSALKIYRDTSAVILALNLKTEYYLKSILRHYTNPIYSLINKSSSLNQYKYISENFEIAYNWYKDPSTKHKGEKFPKNNVLSEGEFYRYIRDRLGYFLIEFERSLIFARRALERFNPEIIYGRVENYKGSSVIQGTLKPTAFFVLAKSTGVRFINFRNVRPKITARGLIGFVLSYIRLLQKQRLEGECEILILANPRNLIMMFGLIKYLRKTFKVRILTYNVLLDTKRRLDMLYPGYLEKEKLFNDNSKPEKVKIKKIVKNFNKWTKFLPNKYRGQPLAIKFIRNKIKKIIDEEASEIIDDYLLAQKVMTVMKPKVVLTTTDPDSKILPYVDKANELGIKTVNLQHGVFFSVDPPANVPESQYFITWSKFTRTALSRNKYFEKVKMLQWQSPFHSLSSQSYRKPKQGHIRLLILVAIDLLDINYKDYYYKKLFDLLNQSKLGLEIIVRTHPFQDLNSLKVLAAESRLVVRLDTNPDLDKSIRWADVVIFENTTAGLDSMLLGKPTIYFNPYTGSDLFNLVTDNASLPILHKKDLSKIIIFLKNDYIWPEYSRRGRRFAKDYLGLSNKRHFDKIADILEKIISNLNTHSN